MLELKRSPRNSNSSEADIRALGLEVPPTLLSILVIPAAD
jgi:hypothetical protein